MPITKYHTVAEYGDVLGALTGIARATLFEFARLGRGHRDTICGNFVARSITMSRSIFTLYEAADYQDCWILHRCLMDRHWRSSVLSPGRRPWSRSVRRTQLRSVSAEQPILEATDWIVAHWEPCSYSCSCTSRTARSRTSAENCLVLLMAPFSQDLEPPANPGRIKERSFWLFVRR